MRAGRHGGRALAAVVRAAARRPGLTLVLAALLAAVGMLHTIRALGFVTEHLTLLPQQAPYVVRLKEYQRAFGELNDIIAVVDSSRPATSRAYAARLEEELRRRLPAAHVRYRIDPAWIERRGLLYLSVESMIALRDRVLDAEEFIGAYAARPTLAGLLEGLNQQMARAIAGAFLDLGLGGTPAGDLRFIDSLLVQMSGRLEGPATYVSPWATAFSGGAGSRDDEHAGWFFSADRRLLFVFVQPRLEAGGFGANRAAVRTIRAAVAALSAEFPDVRTGVTGGPAISSDEMATAFADSNIATALALVATLGLMLLFFRRAGAPLLMLVTLVTSLAWSMGLVTLIVGHLNIFSVMFISIVVGIGIDYGIYFLYRYDEERALGAPDAVALELTAERTGPGILLGALAAAGTFLVLMLTEFQGIREFGLVSGVAILTAFASMLTVFPALLTLASRRRWRRPAVPAAPAAVPLEASSLQRMSAYRRTILGIAAIVTALAAWAGAGVDFDYNLLRLQAKGVESVVWEERIIAQAGRSTFAALATASSLDELRSKQRALEALDSVSEVDSLLRLVPDRQDEKIRLIRQLAPSLATVSMAAVPPLEPESLRGPLTTLRRRLDLATEGAASGSAPPRVYAVRSMVDDVLAKLRTGVAPDEYARLQQMQMELATDFADKLRTFQQGLDPSPITPEDLPAGLRQRYVGSNGRLLIRIHPAIDIWEHAGATRFIGEIRSVDPDVTGPPVTAFESIRLIRRGYFLGALYALALVAITTWAILRSVRGTLLTLAPLVLGIIWTLGLMRAFGLHFTMANVWAVPLIMGTAAEYGLNVYVRYVEGHETGRPPLARSGVLAVLLSGLTTIGGFGSLMVARHQGIFGLGLLLTAGATASLVASLVVAPVLIEMFGRHSSRPAP